MELEARVVVQGERQSVVCEDGRGLGAGCGPLVSDTRGPGGATPACGGGARSGPIEQQPQAPSPVKTDLSGDDDAEMKSVDVVKAREARRGVVSNGNLSNGKKRRCRRKQKGGKHHRRWKPYDQLSWDEKKVLEEKESRRACMKREERFASGQPMAPYNTTQFLMEQHDPEESGIKLEYEARHRHGGRHNSECAPHEALGLVGGGGGSGSAESSDEYYDSPDLDEEGIFLEKDFTEAYENFQAERLQSMTKEELVREHLELESKVERLEKQLKDVGGSRRSSGGDVGGEGTKAIPLEGNRGGVPPLERGGEEPVDIYKVETVQREIQRLREENQKLQMENEHLKVKPEAGGLN